MEPGKGNASSPSFDDLWSTYWHEVQRAGPLTRSRFRLLFAELPATLPARPKLLDVGCGSGGFLERLLAKYPDAEICGIEISPEACRNATPALQDRILCGDVLDLRDRLVAGSFDVVVCSEVLEHVPDPAAIVRALRDLVKPGGTLLLTVPAGMAHWSIQDEAAGHLRRFEYAEFEHLLRGQGLVVDHQYTWGGPVATAYNRLVNAVGPERAANSASSATVRLFAWMANLALRIDDAFKSKRRFQLIARATRPVQP